MDKDRQEQQPRQDADDNRLRDRGPVMRVPDPSDLTKDVSLPASATKDWEMPTFLNVPHPDSGRPAGFEPSFDPEDFEIPAHLRRQVPADQRPKPGEPGFEYLQVPDPNTMRVPRSPHVNPFNESEIPAFLRNPPKDMM